MEEKDLNYKDGNSSYKLGNFDIDWSEMAEELEWSGCYEQLPSMPNWNT